MLKEGFSSTSTPHHTVHVMVLLPSCALHVQNEKGLL